MSININVCCRYWISRSLEHLRRGVKAWSNHSESGACSTNSYSLISIPKPLMYASNSYSMLVILVPQFIRQIFLTTLSHTPRTHFHFFFTYVIWSKPWLCWSSKVFGVLDSLMHPRSNIWSFRRLNNPHLWNFSPCGTVTP